MILHRDVGQEAEVSLIIASEVQELSIGRPLDPWGDRQMPIRHSIYLSGALEFYQDLLLVMEIFAST